MVKKKKDRDIEKKYSIKQTVAKLRRVADCLENGKPFQIQIAGEKISVPTKAGSLFRRTRKRVHEHSFGHNR